MPIVDIPTEEISDWDSFHDVFAEVLAFPDYYGRNMSAWIDCLTYADDEDAGMMSPIVGNGDVLTLQFDERGFAAPCPDQYNAIVECSAFVNWRRIETNERPIVALSFRHQSPGD